MFDFFNCEKRFFSLFVITVVLSSRSRYFSRLFLTSTEPDYSVSEFRHEVFSQFIRSFYATPKDLTVELATELLKCAQYYEVPDLHAHCLRLLADPTGLANAASAAAAAASVSSPAAVTSPMDVVAPSAPAHVDMDSMAGESAASSSVMSSLAMTEQQSLPPRLDLAMTQWSNDPVLFKNDHAMEPVSAGGPMSAIAGMPLSAGGPLAGLVAQMC